jgi:hypothetical protein
VIREQEPRGQTLHATLPAPRVLVQPPVHGGCPVEREAPVEEPGHRDVVGVAAAGRCPGRAGGPRAPRCGASQPPIDAMSDSELWTFVASYPARTLAPLYGDRVRQSRRVCNPK